MRKGGQKNARKQKTEKMKTGILEKSCVFLEMSRKDTVIERYSHRVYLCNTIYCKNPSYGDQCQHRTAEKTGA